MKRKLYILLAILLVAGMTASAQMKRGGQKKEAPKTEQTTKKKENNKPRKQPATKSNEKSSKQSSSIPNANKSSSSQTNVATARPAEPTAYDVKFSCNVSEAKIYIDGNDYGKPSGTRTLKIGSHQVKLVAEGYENYTTTINVASGRTSFDFKMKSAIPAVVQQAIDDMVYVEGGTFMMGATTEQGRDAEKKEKPAHQVTLSSFYIGKYEVTQELWQAVMGSNPSNFKGDSLRPVELVSWNKCQEFISKLNLLTGKQFRLPTEAEWEFAARGGNQSRGYKYAGSNTLNDVAWYYDNSGNTTHPVGQKSPNELGLYDMSGNVCEWCQDRYSNYQKGTQTNPTGGTSSDFIQRGGSYFFDSRYCRVSYRSSNPIRTASECFGFRLAL